MDRWAGAASLSGLLLLLIWFLFPDLVGESRVPTWLGTGRAWVFGDQWRNAAESLRLAMGREHRSFHEKRESADSELREPEAGADPDPLSAFEDDGSQTNVPPEPEVSDSDEVVVDPEIDRPTSSWDPERQVSVLAEDLQERLAVAGAGSGEVQISLMWNNINDLDLHCEDPNGELIYFRHRLSRSGGRLDVDRNASAPLTDRPVENIYWAQGRAPAGTYRVFVHHYRNYGAPDPTSFLVRIITRGQVMQFTGSVSLGSPRKPIHEFVLEPR